MMKQGTQSWCSGTTNPEGWGGEGGGRRFQDGGIHVHPWLAYPCQCMAKNIVNIFCNNNTNIIL